MWEVAFVELERGIVVGVEGMYEPELGAADLVAVLLAHGDFAVLALFDEFDALHFVLGRLRDVRHLIIHAGIAAKVVDEARGLGM